MSKSAIIDVQRPANPMLISQVSTYLVPASSPTSQSEPPTPVDPTSAASSTDKSPAVDAAQMISAHDEEKEKKKEKEDSMTRARRAQSWAQRRQQSDLRVEIPTTYQEFQHMNKGKCHSTFFGIGAASDIYCYSWVSGFLYIVVLFCGSDFPMEGDDVEHLVKAGSESNCDDDASPIVRGSSTAVGTPQLSPRGGSPTVRQAPSSDEGKIIAHFYKHQVSSLKHI